MKDGCMHMFGARGVRIAKVAAADFSGHSGWK
jgi:hypothetical protein